MAGEAVPVEALKSWLAVEQARERAEAIVGNTNALDALWTRVKNGLIRAYAMRSAVKQGQSGTPTPRLVPVLITTENWRQYHKHMPVNLWRGEVVFLFRGEGGGRYGPDTYVSCFDIRLDPADVDREFPQVKPAEATPPIAGNFQPVPADALPVFGAKHPGGAPSKPFWDDLWAAIGALICKGVLHPGSKQKDIEEAMLRWASDHDYDLSVPSARTRARKLLAELKQAEKDNN